MYVVDVADIPPSEGSGMKVTEQPLNAAVARRLRKALAHLLFICHAIGDLRQAVVCITLTNCARFKNMIQVRSSPLI